MLLEVVPSILVDELSEVSVLLDEYELVENSSSELEDVFSRYVLEVELESVLLEELAVDQELPVDLVLMSELDERELLDLELRLDVDFSSHVLDVDEEVELRLLLEELEEVEELFS